VPYITEQEARGEKEGSILKRQGRIKVKRLLNRAKQDLEELYRTPGREKRRQYLKGKIAAYEGLLEYDEKYDCDLPMRR